ncbi:MAG: hypothetical protein ACREBH_01405 [Candidatus Micrarchaeaceae archaeon]
MGRENEIAVLDVRKADVMKRIRAAGARHIGSYHFRRVEFLLKGNVKGRHSWGRIRDDGKCTTVTFKELKGSRINEVEAKAYDFKDTVKIMTRIVSPKLMVYFENDRELYSLGKAEISINKWPRIPYFVEIEAPSMKEVNIARILLGINGRIAVGMPIHKIYKAYGLDFTAVMGRNRKKLMGLM